MRKMTFEKHFLTIGLGAYFLFWENKELEKYFSQSRVLYFLDIDISILNCPIVECPQGFYGKVQSNQ